MNIFILITHLYRWILLVEIMSCTFTFFKAWRRFIGALPASITSFFTVSGSRGGMPNSLLPAMELVRGWLQVCNQIGVITHPPSAAVSPHWRHPPGICRSSRPVCTWESLRLKSRDKNRLSRAWSWHWNLAASRIAEVPLPKNKNIAACNWASIHWPEFVGHRNLFVNKTKVSATQKKNVYICGWIHEKKKWASIF